MGSTHHVNARTSAELEAVIGYFNCDMVASPNFTRFVYDGDGSGTGVAGPDGSGIIERIIST